MTEMSRSEGRHQTQDARRRRRRASWVFLALGLLLVAAVGGWQLYATSWTVHSERTGEALVRRFVNHALRGRHAEPGGTASLRSCSRAQGPSAAMRRSTPVFGILEIPKLGVVAPVEQGMGDAQLAVAVGHNPYSVWPGKAGNAVLYAHDVSYFTSISELKSGDTVRYLTPCTTYDFEVTSHAVIRQGSPVYNTEHPSLTLVTCWPTDALWFTPDRYLVSATEVSQQVTHLRTPRFREAPRSPAVPVPPALASQGVTLTTYPLPMGSFRLAGSANRAWAQTTAPLLVEESAVEAFIAGVRSLGEDRLDWWRPVAPGVAPPGPLVGAGTPGFVTPTDVTEQAAGTAVSSVALTDTVSITGGAHPGMYSMAVGEKITHGTLTISSWSMTPV
jgi:sortase A